MSELGQASLALHICKVWSLQTVGQRSSSRNWAWRCTCSNVNVVACECNEGMLNMLAVSCAHAGTQGHRLLRVSGLSHANGAALGWLQGRPWDQLPVQLPIGAELPAKHCLPPLMASCTAASCPVLDRHSFGLLASPAQAVDAQSAILTS